MAYYFYLSKMLCPVPPPSITMKINGSNKTYTMINDGEINILKTAGLTDINFDISLPNVKQPYAIYKNGYKNSSYFLDQLEKLKSKAFQFIVTRSLPNGNLLFDTNMKVTLEDYTIKEDAKEGFDLVVTVNLKQYRDFGTKSYKVSSKSKSTNRSKDTSPEPKTKAISYKIKKGDTLFKIAKRYYDDGSLYKVLWDVNKKKVPKPNHPTVGVTITLPVIVDAGLS